MQNIKVIPLATPNKIAWIIIDQSADIFLFKILKITPLNMNSSTKGAIIPTDIIVKIKLPLVIGERSSSI